MLATSSAASSASSSVNNLAGVWAISEDFGADESFIVIKNDNTISAYDYAGDSYDNAGKCYWVADNIATIKSLSDNNYSIQPAAKKAITIKITLEGKSMTIANLNPTESNKPSVYVLSDHVVTDFTPECSTLAGQSQPSGVQFNRLLDL